MTDLAARLQNLSADRKRLLARRVGGAQNAATGRDRLVVFAVAKPEKQVPDTKTLRNWLGSRLPDHMIPDMIEPLDEMPRLPNGKIDRQKLSALPLDLRPPADVAPAANLPADEAERQLAEIWTELLGVHPITRDDNFFELGGDSIVAIQFVSRARQAGIWLEPADIAEHQTIADLAQAGRRDLGPGPSDAPQSAPALPIQQWHLNRGLARPDHWNLTRLFRLDGRVDANVAEKALEACIATHASLRTRFAMSENGWQQICDLDGPKLHHMTMPRWDPSRLQEIADEAHRLISVEGPLSRFVYIGSGDGDDLLMIVAHHLIIDEVSWFLLAEDFRNAAEGLITDETAELPAAVSPLALAVELADYARGPQIRSDISPWVEIPPPEAFQLSANNDEGLEKDAQVLHRSLGQISTGQLFGAANQAYNTQPLDLLLSGLAITMAEWNRQDSVVIELETHGRDVPVANMDTSRIIGWMTAYFPICLECAAGTDPETTIKHVKEAYRRYSRCAVSYGVARYLSDPDIGSCAWPKADLLFNFMGKPSGGEKPSLLTPVAWRDVAERAGENQRSHAIEINARIERETLGIDLIYSPSRFSERTVVNFVDAYLQALEDVAAHCLAEEAGGFTPSDFPEAEMDQSELDDFLDALDAGDE